MRGQGRSSDRQEIAKFQSVDGYSSFATFRLSSLYASATFFAGVSKAKLLGGGINFRVERFAKPVDIGSYLMFLPRPISERNL
jgi:hypothetical protein